MKPNLPKTLAPLLAALTIVAFVLPSVDAYSSSATCTHPSGVGTSSSSCSLTFGGSCGWYPRCTPMMTCSVTLYGSGMVGCGPSGTGCHNSLSSCSTSWYVAWTIPGGGYASGGASCPVDMYVATGGISVTCTISY